MALISCKECKAEISSAAPACPKCGAPVKPAKGVIATTYGAGKMVFIGFMALLVSMCAYTNMSAYEKTKAEAAAKPAIVAKKLISRDALREKFPVGTNAQVVLDALGSPRTRQENGYTQFWYYDDVAYDPITGNKDRVQMVFEFLNLKTINF